MHHRIALVGSETLIGREIREVLNDRQLPVIIELVGATGEAGLLTEEAGEAAVISPLAEAHLNGSAVALLAGSPASSRKAARLASESAAPPVLIDLTYALEDRPSARLRAPLVEPDGFDVPDGAIHVVAHPAATMLATVLSRLHLQFAVKHSVVQVFEPASERGQRGLDELQQQTVGLLSFRKLETDFFDAQLGFNMLPRYGAEAMEPLEDVEHRIDRHLATLLNNLGPGSHAPMPSLRVVQAPVFHGYSASLWIEFEDNPGEGAIEKALESAQIEIRKSDQEPPTNAGAAGQSGLTVGLVEADRNNPRAVWLWVVADNLRISAEAAATVATRVIEGRGND
jgi:aspartate-semialdehyde dehydrogenase